MVRCHIKPFLASLPLVKVQPEHVEAWLATSNPAAVTWRSTLRNLSASTSLRSVRSNATAFASFVADTLREFGFEPDSDLDPDLDEPARQYAALWIAELDGRVVGSVALRDLGDGALQLKRMYLRRAQRGRGLGKRLLETAVDWARARGTAVIRLDTSERMEAAQALYEAYGFRRLSGDAPRQGQTRLLYELRL